MAEQQQSKAVQTTGHAWDGDLQEFNNPLPRWWLWSFYATVVFAVIYWIIYPAWPVADTYTKGIGTVTFESGSGTYPAGSTMMGDDAFYTSDTNDPVGPFFGQSVHFLGTVMGGQPQIYRYRLDFDDDVQLNSIVISGAAWWGGGVRRS